jgi:cytochrome P450
MREKFRTFLPVRERTLLRFKEREIPPISGKIMFGHPMLLIHTADALNDIYINKNKYLTKSIFQKRLVNDVVPESIAFQMTEHPKYAEKRKVLSGIFFKQKLIEMTTCIKQCTLDNIRLLQQSGKSTFDVPTYTFNLQTDIIIACALGSAFKDRMVDYEDPATGAIRQLNMNQLILTVFHDCFHKYHNPLHYLFPNLYDLNLWPSSRVLARNAARCRQQLKAIIADRRKNLD